MIQQWPPYLFLIRFNYYFFYKIKNKFIFIFIIQIFFFTAQYSNVLPPPKVFDVEHEVLVAELELVPTLQLATTAELEWRMEAFLKILY